MSGCNTCQEPDDLPPVTPAQYQKGAKIKRGGTCFLFLTYCNAPAFDETDFDAWQDSVDAGYTFPLLDCGIEGDFAEEATTTTIGCNAQEVVTNRPKVLTIIDRRDTADLDRAKFWRWVQENPDAFRVAWVTHDGILSKSARVHINPLTTTENTTNGFHFKTVRFTWTDLLSPETVQLAWSPASLVLPDCYAQLSVVGPDLSGDYTITATVTGTGGVTSVTSYSWFVNNVQDGTKTLQTETFSGLAPNDEVKVVVTMILGNGSNCQATQTYKI